MHPVWGVLLATLTLSLTACASLPRARAYEGDLPATVVADWNDIDAAMSRTVKRTETAVVGRTEIGQGEKGSRIRLDMLSVLDDQFWLEFEALETWPGPEGGPAGISINTGSLLESASPFQRAVVGEVIHHLEALAGKDTAPAN